MTNPLLYDIKRVFTSKSVLILMTVMILLSLLLFFTFSASTQITQGNFANIQVLTWYDSGGTYHYLAFAWNQFGQPVSGVTFQLNLTIFSQGLQFNCPSPSAHSATSSTNSSGDAEFSISAPINSNYGVCLSFNQPSGFTQNDGPFTTPYDTFPSGNGTTPSNGQLVPPGQVVGLISGEPLQQVSDSNNVAQENILINWAGAYGALPSNYPVYYKFINATEQCITIQNGQECSSTFNSTLFQSLNESNMAHLTNLNSYLQVIVPPPLQANITASDSTLAVGLFYPNGTSVASVLPFSTSSLYPQQSSSVSVAQGNTIVIGFFQSIFGLFIPLIAILGSYNSYGKDRVSGVLESVLAQPVSRRGLSISRFLSSFIAMAIAVSISMAIVDIIAFYFTKSFLDANLLLPSAGAFFVELAAFIGLMMLLSRALGSSGALIGIGIGLFLLFDVFWPFIIGIVNLLLTPNTGFFSTSYFQVLVAGEFLNPAQFVALIDTYLTHTISQGGIFGGLGFGLTITPSAYGITIPTIVATAILWIVLPLAGFLYLAIKRD